MIKETSHIWLRVKYLITNASHLVLTRKCKKHMAIKLQSVASPSGKMGVVIMSPIETY